MAGMEKLSISLTPDMAAAVHEAVASGDYASPSEVVQDALSDWSLRRGADREQVLELRRLWQEGLDSGPSEPLDMAEIKREARARLAQES